MGTWQTILRRFVPVGALDSFGGGPIDPSSELVLFLGATRMSPLSLPPIRPFGAGGQAGG